jgi:HSP20 family protein
MTTVTITRFTPMTDIVSLREAMDRLFEDSFIRPTTWTGIAAGQIAVPVDLWETNDAYHLRADLPGMTPDTIDINVTADTVSFAGETKTETDVANEGWLRQERRIGKFQRSFTLPVEIDPNKVQASFEHGVLDLVLPKADQVKPRSIKVNANKLNANKVNEK